MTTEQVETDIVQTRVNTNKSAAGTLTPGEAEPTIPHKRNLLRILSRSAMFLVVALIIAGTAQWWIDAQGYESTDDAQIEGHLDSVSPRISGTVTYINPKVENNRFVEAGTLLLELDPRDYEADLEHAKANLEAMTADAHSAQVTV